MGVASSAVDFEVANISCPAGLINVQSATYGSMNKRVDRKAAVQAVCENRPNCSVRVAPQEFGGDLGPGDPEPGVGKFLSAQVTCSNKATPTVTKTRMDELASSSNNKWWIILVLIVIIVLILLFQRKTL